MPFDYYEHLRPKQKATYRRSDAVLRLPIPDGPSLAPLLEALRTALEADDRSALGRSVTELTKELMARWNVAPVTVRVLARRPKDEESELHGLYVREADGTAVISLWMRTAAQVRPVRFRTFVRTFAHEVLHHLDFELLELEDTFHTAGFFQRESDVTRQLLGDRPKPAGRIRPPARPRDAPADEQLSLFATPGRKPR